MLCAADDEVGAIEEGDFPGVGIVFPAEHDKAPRDDVGGVTVAGADALHQDEGIDVVTVGEGAEEIAGVVEVLQIVETGLESGKNGGIELAVGPTDVKAVGSGNEEENLGWIRERDAPALRRSGRKKRK